MFTVHLFAENEQKAVEVTRSQYPTCLVGSVYLDAVWKNSRRWCVEVYGHHEGLPTRDDGAAVDDEIDVQLRA